MNNLLSSLENNQEFPGEIWAFVVAWFALFAVLFIAIWIVNALAWQKIGKDQGYKYTWFAWVPILNIIMILQMGRFSAWWVLLFLIPFAGLIVAVQLIIAQWRIFEKAGYKGWLSLLTLLSSLTVLIIVAWGRIEWKGERTMP